MNKLILVTISLLLSFTTAYSNNHSNPETLNYKKTENACLENYKKSDFIAAMPLCKTASKLVPIMSLIYIIGGLYIIVINYNQIPTIFFMIIESAFTGTAASGGFAGATIWMAIRFGVSRGVFSNEAGLGSSPIAHAAARTNSPIKQGSVSMLEPLIDTIIVSISISQIRFCAKD